MRDAERLFKALADDERLRLLSLLLLHADGACVCELVDALRIPQYRASRQLRVLREACLVTGEKRGTWVYYRVPSGLTPLARAIVSNLVAHLEDETMGERKRFTRRLRLRQAGLCTVGYPQEAPYRDFIPVVSARRGTQEADG